MKRILLGLTCLAGLSGSLHAQESPAPAPPQKKWNQQIGVQINELIRQVFNFDDNNDNNTLRNPYLLIYSLNSAQSGWGLRAGLGYNYRSFSENDGVTRRDTKINELRARLGIEKSFSLSERWTTGIGLDGVIDYDNNKTTSVVRSFDTTTTVTSTKVMRLGGGTMGWLRYSITPRILVGTETSFYYKSGDEKQKVRITRRDFTQPPFPPQYITTETTSNEKNSEGSLNVPVAFYLIIKF